MRDARIHAIGRAATRRALQLGDRLVQELDVELEPERRNVARLLAPSSSPAPRISRSRIAIEKPEPSSVCRPASRAGAASAELHGSDKQIACAGTSERRLGRGSVELGSRACRRARRRACSPAMSRPDSIIVVETSTSASPRRNCIIRSSSSRSRMPVGNQNEAPAQLLSFACTPRSSRPLCSRTIGRSLALAGHAVRISSRRTRRRCPDRLAAFRRVSMIEMSRRPASDIGASRGTASPSLESGNAHCSATTVLATAALAHLPRALRRLSGGS